MCACSNSQCKNSTIKHAGKTTGAVNGDPVCSRSGKGRPAAENADLHGNALSNGQSMTSVVWVSPEQDKALFFSTGPNLSVSHRHWSIYVSKRLRSLIWLTVHRLMTLDVTIQLESLHTADLECIFTSGSNSWSTFHPSPSLSSDFL